MDFLEIQNFCGFDLEKANALAQGYAPLNLTDEVATDVAILESESGQQEPGGGLRDPGDHARHREKLV